MRLRTMICALTTAALVALSAGTATAATGPQRLQKLAQQQTNLLLKYYTGQNASPARCGQGQGPEGIDGTFLLPVLSFAPGDRTFNCKTKARSVLVDLGGAVITEDNRFPDSSWILNGEMVPFSRRNLERICNDVIAQGFLGTPAPATVDGRSFTGPTINSTVFTAEVNRKAQMPTDPVTDLYADSVALGHPGRLASVFCGFKAKLRLGPGKHTIVVDHSVQFPEGSPSTVFTFAITVKDDHRN
jgi:hypothetical protein